MSRGTTVTLALAACAVAACGTGSNDDASTTASTPATTLVTTANDRGGESTAPGSSNPNTASTSTPESSATTTSASASSSAPTAPPATVAVTTTVPSPGGCVEQLDLAAAAALTVWPAVGPGQWDDAAVAVDELGVGGLVLFEPRGSTADEVARRLSELEAASHHGLLIATDEEGGVVQRLSVVGDLPSQNSVGTEFGPGAELAEIIRSHGEAVRALGVDIVFGPVVDVAPATGNPPLAASRFFPGGPADVAALASTYVDAWNDAGLLATLKHFPGHGSASADTHDGGATTPDLATLTERDLVPYRELGDRVADGGALVMVGHLTVPDLTDGVPATRSPAAIELLRSLPGYDDAVIVSDALGMGAVGLDEAAASVAALAAGIDVVIFTRTEQTDAVIDAIVDAVEQGDIDEAALRNAARRVMALLERDGHSCDSPAT